MDGKKRRNSEDIQTDAQLDPEENDGVSSSPSSLPNESALRDQPCRKKSPDASSEPCFVSLIFAQTARPITSSNNDEHLAYIEQMPDNLREENIDILIINADCDRNEAARFQNHLTKDILFYIHGQARSPRVRLLDEVRHGSMDNLDFAFSKALYVFLYVTKDFCSEPWTLLRGQACLTEAIHDFNKKWCVVPIHTASKRSQRYKLPMMLNSLRPINYWSGNQDQFYIEGVRKLLESKAGLLLERERLLDQARQKYFDENRTKLLKNAEYKGKGLSVCKSNPSHQVLASDCSPLTYSPSVVEDSSKSSAIHTSSSNGDVYQTNVQRYSSFTNEHEDKALPGESLAVVRERLEDIAVSENEAVDQNNDLRVIIRYTTDQSSQRPSQEGLHQLYDRNGELSQVSGSSHERQSQGMPEQASCRSHERQSQGITQQLPDRSHERQNQGITQQLPDRSHERQNQGITQQLPDRSHERQNQGITQQLPDRSHERQNQGITQQLPDRSHERQNQGITQQLPDRSHERQNQGITQQLPDRSHERQNQGITQQISSRNHEKQSHGTPQQASDRSLERQNQGTAKQISSSGHERQRQGTPQQVSGRSHNRQNQSTAQQPQISAAKAATGGIEHSSIRNNTCATRELNSIDVDGPDGDDSFLPTHENHAPQFYEHRSVPITTAPSFQSNIPPALVSAPHNVHSGIATPDHPTPSPRYGQFYNSNYQNAMGSPSYFSSYFNQVPPAAFYPPYIPHPYPHHYPHPYPHPQSYMYPSQHYTPVRPNTMQDLYAFVNPPPFFYQNEMRSQSQISMVASSNDSIHTSVEGNAPDSGRSNMSHSLSTGALSVVGSLPGLSSHWSPSENLSHTDVPFHPQPVSSQHFQTPASQINHTVEEAPAITVQQPQPHVPSPAGQGSFDASYFQTGEAVAAADTHSSSKSDRTFSAGLSSAATSVIQHIHHHHHKKNITVANATNVLIGDKSQILNRRSVDVISDDESGDDNDAEDDTEAQGGSGPSNSTRENCSGSSGNRRGASVVRPGNEEGKNVSMGFAEFLSPSSRQPVERSEDEHSVGDDGNDQTCHKKLL